MTQTTDERIRDLLLDRLNIMDGTFRAAQATDVASQIAAEIDTLAERNAFLLASAEAAQANLAACRRELAEARAFISTVVDSPNDYPAEVSA